MSEARRHKGRNDSFWPRALRVPWLLVVFGFMLSLIAVLEVALRVLPSNSRSRLFNLAENKNPGPSQAKSSSRVLARRLVTPVVDITLRHSALSSSWAEVELITLTETLLIPPSTTTILGSYQASSRNPTFGGTPAAALPGYWPKPSKNGDYGGHGYGANYVPGATTITTTRTSKVVKSKATTNYVPEQMTMTRETSQRSAFDVHIASMSNVKNGAGAPQGKTVTIPSLLRGDAGTTNDDELRSGPATSRPSQPIVRIIELALGIAPSDTERTGMSPNKSRDRTLMGTQADNSKDESFSKADADVLHSRTPSLTVPTADSSALLLTDPHAFESIQVYATSVASADSPGKSDSTAPTDESEDIISIEVVVSRWPMWKVFIGNYFPVLLAVLLRMIWTPIAAACVLVQPFLLMTRRDGAAATDVLFLRHLSTYNNPVRMWSSRSWLSMCSGVNLLLLTLIGPLSSEAIFLDTQYGCSDPGPDPFNPCWPPKVSADFAIIRVIQSLLSVAALLTFGIAVLVSTATLSLRHDPSTLAGVHDLFRDSSVLQKLQRADESATTGQLKKAFLSQGLVVEEHVGADGSISHRIAPAAEKENLHIWRPADERHGSRNMYSTNPQSRGHSSKDAALLSVIAILSLGLFGVVIAYYQDGSASGFNEFFNSNTFGPAFITTTSATVICICYGSLLDGVSIAAPFRRLRDAPSTSYSTLQLSKSSLPIIAFVQLLRHGYIMPATVAATTFFLEVLVIFAAALPFSPARVELEFFISAYACMGILSLALVCAILTLVYTRGFDVPRTADTLAGVLSYFCASRMSLSEVHDAKKDERYTYTKARGIDGVERWMIDVCR